MQPHTDSEDDDVESECEHDKSIMVEQLSDDISDESLLETKSMRQKYRIAHKLPLPSAMKHLFNLFCQLDTYLNLLKRRRQATWQVTHTELQKMIEHSLRRNFKISQFCQILTVCPNFFIHKWEMKHGKSELFLEIPGHINEILNCEPVPETEEGQEEQAYFDSLNDELLQKRREQFSEELVAICYEHF